MVIINRLFSIVVHYLPSVLFPLSVLLVLTVVVVVDLLLPLDDNVAVDTVTETTLCKMIYKCVQ